MVLEGVMVGNAFRERKGMSPADERKVSFSRCIRNGRRGRGRVEHALGMARRIYRGGDGGRWIEIVSL